MSKFLLSFSFIACLLFSACKVNVLNGEGNKVTTAPTVPSFDEVDVDLSLKVEITVQQGATPALTINGYQNLLQHIRGTVNHHSLRIYSDLDKTWTMNCDDVKVRITLPQLNSLTLSGATDANIYGNIQGQDFKLDQSGASKVVIDNIHVDNFLMSGSGATELTVKGGTVKQASYDISGAGDIKAFPLQSDETIASISGAGSCQVSTSRKLSADISGAGTIEYKGHPELISKEISGAGSLSDAN